MGRFRVCARQSNMPIDIALNTAIVRAMAKLRPATTEPAEPEPDEGLADPVAELGDLAALAEADQDWRWQVHRLKSADEMQRNPRGKPRVFVTTIHGGVDLADFHSRRGGGTYEFWGSQGGSLRTRVTVELEGAPKMPAPEPPPAPIVSHPASVSDPFLILLDRMDRRLAALETAPRLAAPPAEKPATIKELAETLVMLNKLNVVPASNPEREIVNTYFAMVEKGIELGQQRDPLPAGEQPAPDWAAVIEKSLPLVDRFLSQLARRPVRPPPPRPATNGPPPPAPPGPSSAEVVNEAPPAQAEEVNIAAVRQIAVVDALARAITQGVEASDFAGTVADLLTDAELAAMLAVPPELVIGDIVARASAQYPILAHPGAEAYIRAVLDELREASKEPAPPAGVDSAATG